MPRRFSFAKRIFARREQYPGLFRRSDPSFLAPRDFDVSPYFEIVKFNVIADGTFDYQRVRWAEDVGKPDVEDEASTESDSQPAATSDETESS